LRDVFWADLGLFEAELGNEIGLNWWIYLREKIGADLGVVQGILKGIYFEQIWGCVKAELG
jgi:hypothetical protein